MIGDPIIELFSSWGWLGMILALYLLSVIDSISIPTLPDIFAILIFLSDVSWEWGFIVLVTAVAGDITGDSILYYFVKNVKIPKAIKKASKKYVQFFLVSDERLIFFNRFAPVMPFCGAFIALMNWDYKKSMFYVITGGIVRYGAIFLMVGAFNLAWTEDTAQKMSIILIITMVSISVTASYFYKKRKMKMVKKKAMKKRQKNRGQRSEDGERGEGREPPQERKGGGLP